MATQGIVADTQPFVNSETPSNLKAIVARRIKVAEPYTYESYLRSLDKVISDLENLGVFNSKRSLEYALKDAKTNQGEISNHELIKLLLEQQRLQHIFAKISRDKSFNNLEQAEIEYLMQHPAGNVQAFVSKYQQELESVLEMRFSEKIDMYLLRSF